MNETEKLLRLDLAPYIIKATALIGVSRNVGGNQFRHAISTFGVLLDYKYFDNYVLLKASVLHDLLEDIPETNQQELRNIDYQANEVVDLVLEVTRPQGMKKADYLKRILETGSRNAKILKAADRISNLTDLHRDQYSRKKMRSYLKETEEYVLKMALEVNNDMAIELKDLISKRMNKLRYFSYIL